MPEYGDTAIKRVNLLASSFSGSTLFGILLCQDERYIGFGDTYIIPGISDENAICNCGSTLLECDFRVRLAEQLELRKLPTGMILDRKYCIPGTLISSRFEGTRFSSSYQFIGRALGYERAYSSFLKRENGFLESLSGLGNFEYFLDGTKSIVRADIFTTVSAHSKIIHLIRNPLSVIHSTVTRHEDRGQSISFNIRSWIRYNLRARKLCEENPERSAVVLFDNLIREPDVVLELLSRKLGLSSVDVESDNLRPELTHLMGNRSRHKATKVRANQLQPDAEDLIALGVAADEIDQLSATYEYLQQPI